LERLRLEDKGETSWGEKVAGAAAKAIKQIKAKQQGEP